MSIALTPIKRPEPTIRPHYRFTVEQYHRMVQSGILSANDRVELIEGLIVEKKSHNPPHDSCVSRVMRVLARLLPDEWVLRVQAAITLGNSEPEPDLAIVRGPIEVYDVRHPVPRDVGLLIEVADSSLLGDRRRKGILYAGERIPEFWILNLVDSTLEVYTQPKGGKSPAYKNRKDVNKHETVPLILDGQEIAHLRLGDLLP